METNEGKTTYFSVLAAVILLIFAFSARIQSEHWEIRPTIFGFSLQLSLTPNALIIPLTALIAGVGVYSVVEVDPTKGRIQKSAHTIIPFAATFSLGVLLGSVAMGIGWIIILFFGGILIFSIFSSESTLGFRSDSRSALSSVFVTALAYVSAASVFLVARGISDRLIFLVPYIFFSTFLIGWRVFLLDSESYESVYKAFTSAIISTEIGAALFYVPIRSISFGSLLFAGFYLSVNLIIMMTSGFTIRAALRRLALQLGLIGAVFIYLEFIQ